MKLAYAVLLVTLSINVSPSLKISRIFTIDDGLPSNEIRMIYNDPAGLFWAGTTSGAARKVNDTWEIDSRETNPVTQGVSSIYKDSRGNFWFGGLAMCHVYNGTAYDTHTIKEDMRLDGRVVFSFYEDSEGKVWVATTGGVAIFDGSGWAHLPAENGLSNNVVHDVNQDRSGNFWFATRRGGLNIYNGSKWEYLFPEKNCRKIIKDDQGIMWVGTSDGIIKYDGNNWNVFEEGKTILPMFKGKKGLIWCIANGRDIARISSEGEIIHYENPTNNKANEIFHLEYDQEGNVWAGTDQGIFVLN